MYPRGLVGGCPPPRSADGVIASAQIEYISYVFITTARYVVPLSAAYPRSAARTPRRPTARGRVAVEEGWKVGRRKAEDAEPRSKMREKETRQEGKKGCRRDCGYEAAGGREHGKAGEYEGVATGNQA